MEKIFRELSTAYKNYRRYEKDLDKAYQSEVDSGDRSIKYLNNLKKANASKLVGEQTRLAKRFNKIRADFSEELDRKCDLERSYVSPTVLAVLHSAVNITPREYEKMALTHRNSLLTSRVLHDDAAKHGYMLTNYISYEDSMAIFDELTAQLLHSLREPDAMKREFLTVEDALEACGKAYGQLTNFTIECYPAVNSLEAAIDRERVLADRESAGRVDDGAFLAGFTGKEQKPEKPEDILSGVEKADARMHALIDGRNDVSKKDIEYVRKSDEYAKFREENPVSEKDAKRLQRAVDAAVRINEDSLELGQTLEQAREKAQKEFHERMAKDFTDTVNAAMEVIE